MNGLAGGVKIIMKLSRKYLTKLYEKSTALVLSGISTVADKSVGVKKMKGGKLVDTTVNLWETLPQVVTGLIGDGSPDNLSMELSRTQVGSNINNNVASSIPTNNSIDISYTDIMIMPSHVRKYYINYLSPKE
jgi:hypothetical protein